jgi:hypothetical protein
VNVPAWFPSPPETPEGVWAWFLFIFVPYIVIRKGVARLRGTTASTNMARLSDAATFAGSLMLLVGIVHANTLKAVGDTTGFLIIAAVGGVFYAGEQLVADGKRSKSE